MVCCRDFRTSAGRLPESRPETHHISGLERQECQNQTSHSISHPEMLTSAGRAALSGMGALFTVSSLPKLWSANSHAVDVQPSQVFLHARDQSNTTGKNSSIAICPVREEQASLINSLSVFNINSNRQMRSFRQSTSGRCEHPRESAAHPPLFGAEAETCDLQPVVL